MATFSTYIAWTLTTNHGWSYWPAFAITLLASFAGGAAIHQGIIRPNEKGSVLRVVIVTIGLLLALNGLVTLIWSGEVRAMESPFPTRTIDIAGVAISIQDIGTIGVVLATVVVLWLMFQYTKVGLAMRAAAVNPAEARLVGVRVTWMLSLGWGLAAVLGAISGMLAAPSLFLDPNLMAALLIYAFAAAVLGGIDSPDRRGRRRSDPRRRPEPDRGLRRLRRRRPPASGRAGRDPRRLARQAVRDLRQERGEAGMRRSRAFAPVVAFVVLAVAVAVLPSFVSAFRAQQLAYVAVYLTALIGLNILTGYTGQISLGHGAFMAIGGYTTAILMSDHGVKDLWTIPIAAVVTGVVGFLFGIPALRLSGLYLALATFAIAVSMPAVIKRFEGFTGGGGGINLFGRPELTASLTPVTVLGRELTFNDWLYYLCWTVALVGYVIAWLMLRGRTGRALRAVRDSESAAQSSGVSLRSYKTLAFGVSAAYAGVAGSLFAIATTFVNPDTFPIALSILLLVGVVVGGLGSLVGLIAGAIFIQFLPIWSQQISKSPGAPSVVSGVVLIALMFVLPMGVAGLFARLRTLTKR